MNRIGKLLPNDGFLVIFRDTPALNYIYSLTHLYQPLIGIQSISLYQTLLNESNSENTNLQTHHSLMNYLQISLPDLYEARLKLEGIGLLKTYKQVSSDETLFTYKLQKPFTPEQFFEDAMLSQLLYHHIGEMKYLQLKKKHHLPFDIQGKEITASFNDVFQTFRPEFEMTEQMAPNQGEMDDKLVNLFDYSWLEVMLKQRMIPVHHVLTRENKKIITEITKLYDLATYEIEKAVLWALTEENTLNIEEFKHACHDLFQTKHHKTPIKLQLKSDGIKGQASKDQQKSLSKEDQLIQQFEQMSPKQLLEDLSGGHQASERDLRMIRDVMLNQGLTVPVMNVLVHYVLMQSNMKLSKAYLETIASHWSRAKLTTAREAMDFAKKEIDRFKNRKPTYRKQKSTEIIPDWFNERQEERRKGEQVASNENELDDKEKQELMELLRRY